MESHFIYALILIYHYLKLSPFFFATGLIKSAILNNTNEIYEF